jgi:hypothetical protein
MSAKNQVTDPPLECGDLQMKSQQKISASVLHCSGENKLAIKAPPP